MEGRKQVSRGGFITILVPGQQEIEGKVINQIDIETVMAWKKRVFQDAGRQTFPRCFDRCRGGTMLT